MSQGKTRSQNGPDANLDQIREILFGEQTRDQSKRLVAFEKETAANFAALRKEFKEGIGALSAELTDHLADLTKQLKEESAARGANEKSVAQSLKQLSATLDRRATSLEERLASREKQLRAEIAKTREVLEAEDVRRYDELHAYIDEELEDVRTAHADRVELAEFFQELSLRLKGELKRPAPRQ